MTSIDDRLYGKGFEDAALPEFKEPPRPSVEQLWPHWKNSPGRKRLQILAVGPMTIHHALSELNAFDDGQPATYAIAIW